MSIVKIIVGIIAALFQAFASSVVVFKQTETKKNKLLFFVLFWIYFTLVAFFVGNQFRFILFIIYTALSIYFILHENSSKIILYAINTEIIIAVSEIIITLLLVLVGINSKDIVENIVPNLIANILISLTSILLIYIPFVKQLIGKVNKMFDKTRKLLHMFLGIALLIYVIVSKNGLELILKSNYYVNILFIIGIVLILTIIIKNEMKNEQLNQQNIQMLNHVTKYEKIITEQGKANHEFKNQLMVIRGYAQMNSPKLIEYIDSITDDTKKAHSSYKISQLNKFPEGGIKGLLYYKLSTMEDEKIKYDLDVEVGVKTKLNSLSIVMYKNITKILGVLLDNAIDASKKSKDKKVIVSVTKDKSYVIFTISNTYKGKVDLSKIGTGYTTKGNRHGYGLRLVKDIVATTSVFKIESSCNENYYTTKLIIKVGNKKRKKK